ncbi:hypothetical protein [Kribbella sp. NPDC055071]
MTADERTGGLVRYLTVATAMRVANDGAAVGLALLAYDVLPVRASTIAGLMVAALITPHLTGPWIGRLLAGRRDTRPLLAIMFIGYGVAVASAALLLGRAPNAVAVLAALAAGCAGPFLGGGLTSRLPTNATRAMALDSATWGVATAAGPAVAAALALTIGSRIALLLFAVTAVGAGLLVFLLPAAPGRQGVPLVLRTTEVVRLVLVSRLLVRAVAAAGLAGVGMGTLRVAAPLLSEELDRSAAQGGVLIALYGAGSLGGSLAVAAFRVPGRPDRAAAVCLGLMALTILGAAEAPSYPVAQVCFVLFGLANGPFIAATLQSCLLHAPPVARTQVLILASSIRVPTAAASGVLAGFAGGAGGDSILMAAALALALAAAAAAFLRPISPASAECG